MRLVRFRHKGLRQFHSEDNPKAVPPEMADKLRKLSFALETADGLEQMSRFPGWNLHPLKGGLKGFRIGKHHRERFLCPPLPVTKSLDGRLGARIHQQLKAA